jgi:membrane-associated HD superfamily phosphohydrolase
VTLLEEYIKSGKKAPVSKEATIINLCEDLVNKLMAIFEKDKTAKIDSDRMIEEMIERRHISGSFNHSNLSIAELNRVSKLLKKEKLYYDFLR